MFGEYRRAARREGRRRAGEAVGHVVTRDAADAVDDERERFDDVPVAVDDGMVEPNRLGSV